MTIRLTRKVADSDMLLTMKLVPLPILFALGLLTPVWAVSETTIKKEIDVGFAPMDLVKPVLQEALSP